jgi:excisionase family DNA binding protein
MRFEEGHMANALAVSVREAAWRLGVSPRTVATLIARGELLSRKIGRRRVIPVEALEKFLQRDHPTQRDCQQKPA